MGILKIRNEDGTVQTIAIMKGDKGDKGDRGDIFAHPATVFSNTDTAVASAAITQRGLYEVDVAYFLGEQISPPPPYSDYEHKMFLMSVDDVSKTQKDKYVAAFDSKIIVMDGVQVKENVPRIVTLTYENGTFSSEHFLVGNYDLNRTCIAEVKLLVPYD